MEEEVYAHDRQYIKEFLETFRVEEFDPVYLKAIQSVLDCQSRSINVDLSHLQTFSEATEGCELHENVVSNCRRYATLFADEIDNVMKKLVSTRPYGDDDLDVVLQQRQLANMEGADTPLPALLQRRYDVFFKPAESTVPLRMRDIRANMIGHYVTFKGICTRATDVKPLMEVACYTCEACGQEYFQEVENSVFNPKQLCPSQACGKQTALFIETRASKFVKYQEVRVQELSEDVPIGHIPRSITVALKGDMTRSLSPGDVIDLSGVFLPRAPSSYSMTSSLVSSTYLEAMSVKPHKQKYSAFEETPALLSKLQNLREKTDIYSDLAKSIAPEIYGHVEVKRALLLLLCGGVTRELADGVKIRGDIHVCLMGDPGVAKSQLLKHIVSISPRGVYTTGRGSSGVGLTASIHRDTVTAELTLEGGALVLADRGICCIDEFDKMEESDRTAIHEVMEQQTVSIAKAGITTTLNARTTVLAAANPAYGRYNTSVTPQENINLPAALLSRFDLLWLILDVPNADSDVELARHVVNVHREGHAPKNSFEPVSTAELRAYISVARRFEPYVPEELADDIAGAYADIRQAEVDAGSEATGYTTARTLLSIIRLSESLARLRWSNIVSKQDVERALELMKMSKSNLHMCNTNNAHSDPIEKLYQVLRNWAGEHSLQQLDYPTVNQLAVRNNALDAVDACLDEYAALGIWMVDEHKSITFVD